MIINFDEGKTISSYNVTYTNRDKVSEIIFKLLKKGELSLIKSQSGVFHRNGLHYEYDSKYNKYIDEVRTMARCVPAMAFCDGKRETFRTTFSSPFTIAMGADSLSYEQQCLLNETEREYLIETKNSQTLGCLSKLLHDVKDRERLCSLISYFSGDIDMLASFLETYHPDLANLRKILPYIVLEKEEEYSIDAGREKILDSARENTIIANSLRLTFNKR